MLAKPTLVVSPWQEDGEEEKEDQDEKLFSLWVALMGEEGIVTTAKEVPRQETSPIAGPSGVITSLQPSPNLTLENFPMLQPTPVRNGFSPLSMLWDEGDTIPPDKGGQPITQ
uniref:Uncharacterized protein n=1 Tax=Solanum tuberosum TaxID=4113 RepID=M1DIH7_SOLTU